MLSRPYDAEDMYNGSCGSEGNKEGVRMGQKVGGREEWRVRREGGMVRGSEGGWVGGRVGGWEGGREGTGIRKGSKQNVKI